MKQELITTKDLLLLSQQLDSIRDFIVNNNMTECMCVVMDNYSIYDVVHSACETLSRLSSENRINDLNITRFEDK